MPQASDEFTARFPTGVKSCPTILVGKTATADGSVPMATSRRSGIGCPTRFPLACGLPLARASPVASRRPIPARPNSASPGAASRTLAGSTARKVQWKFQLVEDLAGLKCQEAIKDIQGVFAPVGERLLALQPEFENAAVQVFRDCGAAGAESSSRRIPATCLESVDKAYGDLVDYFIFKCLHSCPDVAPPERTEVRTPAVPARPSN